MNPFTSSTSPTVDALREYVPGAADIAAARIRGRFEGVAIVFLSALAALLIARAPVLDVEVNAQLAKEAAAMRAPEPCWDELPFRKALTQENIDRLCIKPQPPRPIHPSKPTPRE